MGLVNTNTLGMLLKLVAEHKLPADKFVTHEFGFDQMLEAYEVFANAAQVRRAQGTDSLVPTRRSPAPSRNRPPSAAR